MKMGVWSKIRKGATSMRKGVLLLGARPYFAAPRCTESWFASEGIKQNKLVRQPYAKIYVSFTSWLWPFKRHAPDSLLITQVGRFGNAYQQIGNALKFARVHNLKRVFVPESPWLKPETTLPSGIRLISELSISRHSSPGGTVLVGKFFWDQEFSELCGPRMMESDINGLHAALSFPLHDPPFDSRHLVVHLRGGDVFSTPAPKSYGQPPLAFYEVVLKSEDWEKVTIVHEDSSSPVLPRLVKLVRASGITLETQSASLEEDLQTLMRARTLVLSNGSFGRAIIDISPITERFFRFEATHEVHCARPQVRESLVVDNSGEYVDEILRRNWYNTPTQRDLMISYPVEKLTLLS